ncbi:MAG TPA: Rieske 2Fe-2S domain-containing protein [Acidimicrobiales bacterium]|nr:Rieske 2Fe-2S domain-containing protein [Acidimicrobiales bacterium]
MPELSVRAGSVADLERDGRLLTKVGSLPVLVVWHEGRAFAIEDRCPHLGFPLHQGTVEAGLLTCHWHHARFDLTSGCTLDPWADDAIGFDVSFQDGSVVVAARSDDDPVGRLQRRLRDGLEQGITLVMAKATLGLLETGGPEAIVAEALDFGTSFREAGWGSGLTVLVAMANLLPSLEPADRPLALVHALDFVSRDTRGRAPRFPEPALGDGGHDLEQVGQWYRRFVETRSSDAAERSLATVVASGDLAAAERVMFAATTDHVFIDEGHTLDFTNKAFEAVELVGEAHAGIVTSMVRQTCGAERSEETGEWNHPIDLGALVARAEAELADALAAGNAGDPDAVDVGKLAWTILDDDAERVVDGVLDAVRAGAVPEQLGRALAGAAALRITRFHLNNDPGDWNSVHHAFTTANALHQALVRQPTPELLRGVIHGALRVYLDRFLNVPSARLPRPQPATLDDLARCWEVQGAVDEAGQAAYGYLHGGGRREELIAALGHALVQEDAGFHWFQVVEAGSRQSMAWPEGSEESALILTGVARFLAAHTPTRRELATVVRTAARLRRGEALYADS